MPSSWRESFGEPRLVLVHQRRPSPQDISALDTRQPRPRLLRLLARLRARRSASAGDAAGTVAITCSVAGLRHRMFSRAALPLTFNQHLVSRHRNPLPVELQTISTFPQAATGREQGDEAKPGYRSVAVPFREGPACRTAAAGERAILISPLWLVVNPVVVRESARSLQTSNNFRLWRIEVIVSAFVVTATGPADKCRALARHPDSGMDNQNDSGRQLRLGTP